MAESVEMFSTGCVVLLISLIDSIRILTAVSCHNGIEW